MGTLYKRGKKWHAEYTDANGRRVQRSTGTTVKSDAASILLKWETDANNARHGVLAGTKATLTELIEEYRKYRANSGDKHLDRVESRLKRIFDAHGWTKPHQITQVGVETTIRNLIDPKTQLKIALRTQGHYLGCVKSFTKWLVQVRRALVFDPLAAVKRPSFSGDRKLVRRYLLHSEWTWLARTPNALLYETAIQTGFRAGEILSIQPQHVLEDHIYLPGRATKNRKPAKQYISRDLAKRLIPNVPFEVPEPERLAELLRADLEIARQLFAEHDKEAYAKAPKDFLMPENDLGHELDFHALRHTCGAWLAIANVNVKVIQSVMRHSSITLTLDTYGHLMPGAEQEAAAVLSQILSVKTSQAASTDTVRPDTEPLAR